MEAALRLAGVWILALLFVTGCGGGGGGGGGPTDPTPTTPTTGNNPPTTPTTPGTPGDPGTGSQPGNPSTPATPPSDGGSSTPGNPSNDPPSDPPSNPPPPFEDTQAPRAQILFPPTATISEGASILVRGTASDDGTIASVRVNGVDATSTDGFANWVVRVPLTHGRNELTVEATDSVAKRSAAQVATVVTSTPVLIETGPVAIDRDNNRALIVDDSTGSVLSVDLSTGARKILSKDPNDVHRATSDLAIDAAGGRALVLERNAVVAVSLATGARSVLSDADTPNGDTTISGARSIAVDASRHRALVTDEITGSVVAVDLMTGARTRIVSNLRPTGIAVDGNRALVLDNSNTGAVIAVDLNTNVTSVLSSSTVPNGNTPFSRNLLRIAIDSARNRALVLQNELFSDLQPAILAVDLTTGERRTLSNSTTPNASHPFRFPGSIAVDGSNARVLVADGASDTLVTVGVGDGARGLLADTTAAVPAKAFLNTGGIALDSANTRALVVESNQGAVISVDLSNGSTRVLSDSKTPNSLSPFSNPFGIALDTARNRALVVNNSGGEVIATDLTDGSRTEFSNTSTPGTPPFFVSPLNIVLDFANNRVLESTNGPAALLAIGLTGGTRTVFSSARAAVPDRNNPFSNAIGLALDSARGRLLVADNDDTAPTIFAVSLVNGARTVLSATNVPNNVNPLVNPMGIALDSGRNRALVIDPAQRLLMAINLTDGSRTIVSGAGTANPLSFPTGLVVDALKALALVADTARMRAVDLITGERVYY